MHVFKYVFTPTDGTSHTERCQKKHTEQKANKEETDKQKHTAMRGTNCRPPGYEMSSTNQNQPLRGHPTSRRGENMSHA